MLYDVVIIGGGPAGLTAGLYAARARLSTLLIEKASAGGLALTTEWIENYPGFENGISGADLSLSMEKQAKRFGLEMTQDTVTGISIENRTKKVFLGESGVHEAKAIIIASGSHPRSLNIEGEKEFRGRGVSYCATCDGAFFRGEKVAVIGGGDSAVEEAIFLMKFADEVFIVHRGESFRASKIALERASSKQKLKYLFQTVAEKIEGDASVSALHVRNVVTGEKGVLQVKGVFIYIGYTPNTGYLKGLVELDRDGYVITDGKTATSVGGIFAAGDVRQGSLKQVTTAVGEGATSAIMAEKYIEENY
jgi:thioredoxin reductase (NADPH)